jgi:hypothetical protein
VKRILLALLVLVLALGGLGVAMHTVGASSAKRLPTFDMKDLQERDHSLSDDQYKDKVLLIAAFSTWQQVSIEQARELEKFHKAHPEVEIIAFVANDLPVARDFVKREGLSFPCYKADKTNTANSSFSRLFETKRGKVLTLNRVPFVILTDKERYVKFSNLGLTDSTRLGEELGKIAD